MRSGNAWGLAVVGLLVACGSCKGGDDVRLQQVRDDALGYTIQMPVGATQTEHGKDRHVWSWSPDNHVTSYTCIIEPEALEPFTPDAARERVAGVRKGSNIQSAQPGGADGIVVEMAEDTTVHFRETWCFRKGKTTSLVAICTGPAKGSTVSAMATSLQATR